MPDKHCPTIESRMGTHAKCAIAKRSCELKFALQKAGHASFNSHQSCELKFALQKASNASFNSHQSCELKFALRKASNASFNSHPVDCPLYGWGKTA